MSDFGFKGINLNNIGQVEFVGSLILATTGTALTFGGESNSSYFTLDYNLATIGGGLVLNSQSLQSVAMTVDAGDMIWSIDGNGQIGYEYQNRPNNLNVVERVTIGHTGANQNLSAALSINRTDLGLLPPRVTTVQMNAINNPDVGLLVYNTDNLALESWNGSTWVNAAGSDPLALNKDGSNSPTSNINWAGFQINHLANPTASEDAANKTYVDTGLATKQPTGSYITAITGDVAATGPGSVSGTVNSIGGSSAANVHSAELAANAATSSNTASTIVSRDGSGNFSATTITADLIGTSTNFSGSLSGDVTGAQSATVVSSVGGSSASDINTATIAANSATSNDTNSTIVLRDSSGNFSASTITANLTGVASGNANLALSDLASVAINTSLLPGTTGINLGSPSFPFNYLYLPTTSPTNGQIIQNGATILHTYGATNLFVGSGAGNFTLTSAAGNVGLGNISLSSLTSGTTNIAIGGGSLQSVTTASSNTAVGYQAINLNVSSFGNTALGTQSLQNVTSSGNAAVGYQALQAMTTGNNSTAVGYQAALDIVNHNNITAIGYQSLYQNTGGGSNTALGYQSGGLYTSYSQCVFLGSTADAGSSGLSNATAIGFGAIVAATNTIQLGNTSVTSVLTSGNFSAGTNFLLPVTSSGAGQIIQNGTRLVHSFGTNNFFAGSGAGNFTLTGNANVGLGYQALSGNTSGAHNVAIGYQAVATNSTGSNNVGIGYQAVASNTSGGSNVGIGQSAMLFNSTGSFNVGVGFGALAFSTVSNNTAVGYQVLGANTTGLDNTGIGYNAGALRNLYTQSVLIGSGADATSAGLSNIIAIGYGASVSVSNFAQIGNSALTGMGWTGFADMTQLATPSNPSSGHDRLYFKSDDNLYVLNSAGTEGAVVSTARQGSAALVAGTVTISNSSITANSLILLSTQVPGGTQGAPYISDQSAGTGFTITSTSSLDSSTVGYIITELV